MPILPAFIHGYLLTDLESAPDVLARLLRAVPGEAAWDTRPDPERFSLRELIAHLADWEDVFLARLKQTRDEEQPQFAGVDPAQIAQDHDYAHADPAACLQKYRVRRTELAAFLRALSPEEWERSGTHSRIGPMTLETQVVTIAAHDGYHRQQALTMLEGAMETEA